MSGSIRPMAIVASVVTSICSVVLLLLGVFVVILETAVADWNESQVAATKQLWLFSAAVALTLAAGTAWRWPRLGGFLALVSVVMVAVLVADEIEHQWPLLALAGVPALMSMIASIDDYRGSHPRIEQPRGITKGLEESWLKPR